MTRVIGKVVGRSSEGDVNTVQIDLFETDGTTEYEPQFPDGGDWVTVATAGMSNGWTTTTPSEPPQYRKLPDGSVEFRGNISPGTTDATMFTVPADYRHDKPEGLVFPSVGQGGVCVGVKVGADGTLKALGTVSDKSFISLSGIRYSTT